MSHDQDPLDDLRDTSAGVLSFYRIVRTVSLDPTIPHHLKMVEIWNRHLTAEASKLVRSADTTPGGKGRIKQGYVGLRKIFRKANEDYFNTAVETEDGGVIRLKVVSVERVEPKVEPKVENVAESKATKPKVESKATETKRVSSVIGPSAPVGPATPKAPEKPKSAEKIPDTSKLSPTERALLLGTKVEELGAIPLNDDERAEIQKAAEEANALLKKQQEFVEWACRRADAEADVLRTKKGEALWTDAVTVESFPSDPTMRVVLVRSSTAPLLGTHGPSVKHDFRANGIPVTVNHDLMFRQLDNQRLIRSRVIRTNYHEYYVKALKYQEDLYLRGYFRVDGEDRHDLARLYVVSGGKVRQVTEAEYREYENKAASRKKK